MTEWKGKNTKLRKKNKIKTVHVEFRIVFLRGLLKLE